MKSGIYKLLFLTFLLLNESFCYSQILTVITFYKNSNMDVPGAHLNVFGLEISGEIEGKSNFTRARGDFFKFNNQKFIFDGKIVGDLTPLFRS